MQAEVAVGSEGVARVSKSTIFLLISAVAVGALCVVLHSHAHATACSLRYLALTLGALALIKVANSAAVVLPKTLARIVHWIHAIAFEILSLVGVLALRISSYWIRYDRTVGPTNGAPILLIHGYFNTCSVWVYFRRFFAKEGVGPVYTLSLGQPFASIETHAATVARKVAEIQRETGRTDLILVCHSMGGLVGSYYALHLAPPNTVQGIITIASPLQGTRVAQFAPGRCCREMEWRSPFVQGLAASLQKRADLPLYHIATRTDQLIIPYSSALLNPDPAHQCIVEDVGHASLLFSPRVTAQIKTWLQALRSV